MISAKCGKRCAVKRGNDIYTAQSVCVALHCGKLGNGTALITAHERRGSKKIEYQLKILRLGKLVRKRPKHGAFVEPHKPYRVAGAQLAQYRRYGKLHNAVGAELVHVGIVFVIGKQHGVVLGAVFGRSVGCLGVLFAFIGFFLLFIFAFLFRRGRLVIVIIRVAPRRFIGKMRGHIAVNTTDIGSAGVVVAHHKILAF